VTAQRDGALNGHAYLDELRLWLDTHRPEQHFDISLERAIFGGIPGLEAWTSEVHGAGYMCVSWPCEFGGRGLSEEESVATDAEFARAGLPRPTRGLGETLVGPSILAWGTQEQKAKFLPSIVDGTARYCQGFSEPDAGSDLASLSTRGRVDGDEVVLDGQKMWTSFARDANMLFCLCRTSTSEPRHRGISFVIVPIVREDGTPNGIEFRSIRQMTGGREFAETFLEGARAPLSNVIGGLNNGWQVSMTTLAAERGGVTSQHVPFAAQFWEAVDVARRACKTEDRVVRQNLARAYCEVELIRYRGLRQLAEEIVDSELGPLASISKICWSEHAREFSHSVVNLLGPRGMLISDSACEYYEPDRIAANCLFSPGFLLAGGTNEVLRNLVAERVLGLPKT